jgi:DNA-binding MarR family transcriptional regulator
MILERITLTSKFVSKKHKSFVGILYLSYVLRNKIHTLLKKFSLTSEQYNVLRILRGSLPNELRMKEISLRMIEQNSNVPRLVDKLEEKKLVSREISIIDKRETIVKITDKGLNLVLKIDQPFNELVENFISLDDEGEVEKLSELIERLI